ncbi:MAG: hypothetical protein CMJ79_05885 [Planctomycetaceae bacterium]|nr:hypothetical protein [Planctomycetaceae bacterium]|tara:strand:+ start:121 stop:306 length:186 start_codon:yes stop_codon:yes gene_type:complete
MHDDVCPNEVMTQRILERHRTKAKSVYLFNITIAGQALGGIRNTDWQAETVEEGTLNVTSY